MPLYEYICEEDGTIIELRRPMDEADAPVADPDGLGRRFARRLSSFRARSAPSPASPHVPLPTCGAGACPCGTPGGPCSA